MGRWDAVEQPACNGPRRSTHPDLEDLPPLPADFEETFLKAAAHLKAIANDIKEYTSEQTMQHFGGDLLSNGPDGSGAGGGGGGRQQRITAEVFVPAHRAGLVIGHHGETLKRIEKASQCKVQFDQHYGNNENERHERRVIIIGLAEDVEEAKRLIREKVEDPMSRFPTVQIMVPQTRIGMVIGKGGETIRELQEKSGAKVVVQPEHQMEAYSTERAVLVTGDEESIRRAREMIQDLVTGQARAGHLGSSSKPSMTIQIPETCVGAVIGKRAETLKSLQSISGCRIFVEPQASITDSSLRNVHLTGAPEQVAYAQQLIAEKVAQNEGTYGYYGYDPSMAAAASGGVIYQNPNELLQQTTPMVDPSTAMYDYSQYYYQNYANANASASTGQPQAAGQQAAAAPYDYAAYYAAYQQMYPQGAQATAAATTQGQDQAAAYAAYAAQYANYQNAPK